MPGQNEFDSRDSFQIVEVDPRMGNHGISTESLPKWIEFGGRWGDTYTWLGSESPVFPKKDKERWHGTYGYDLGYGVKGYPKPLPVNYTINHIQGSKNKIVLETLVDKNAISGEKAICNNENYTYGISTNKTLEDIKWTAPWGNFNPSESHEAVFQTRSNKVSTNNKVQAEFSLTHFLDGDTLFTTDHVLSKNVFIVYAMPNDFSLTATTGNFNSISCITSVSLNNYSGIIPENVTWNVSPGHSVQSSNNNYVNILSPKGSSANVTAAIVTCGRRLLFSTPIQAVCSEGDGGFEGGGLSINGVRRETSKNVIYPNPTTGPFRLKIPQTGTNDNLKIVVSNLSGEKVSQTVPTKLQSMYLDLDLTGQKEGLYNVTVLRNNKIIFQGRMIKK